MSDAFALGFEKFARGKSRGGRLVVADPRVSDFQVLSFHRPDAGPWSHMAANAHAPRFGTHTCAKTLLVPAHFRVDGIDAQRFKEIFHGRLPRFKSALKDQDPESCGCSVNAQMPVTMPSDK